MKQQHDMEAMIHDGPLRWIVTSRTRPEIEHMIDLEGFGGIGSCSCEHFQFRIAPELREDRRMGARRCSHILVARSAFTDAMIQTIVRSRQQQSPTVDDPHQPIDQTTAEWEPAKPSDRHCQICGEASDMPTCPLCEYFLATV